MVGPVISEPAPFVDVLASAARAGVDGMGLHVPVFVGSNTQRIALELGVVRDGGLRLLDVVPW